VARITRWRPAHPAEPAVAASGVASPRPAPAASVPVPAPIAPAALPTPRWEKGGPLAFTVDLDLLAPLGDGPANAAEWFRDFTSGDGARLGELEAAQDRGVPSRRRAGKHQVFRSDDPLLLEAEGWVDQAECRFYPGLFEVRGTQTRIPNLLLVLQLARSWVERGDAAEDPARAMEDYRRAVRLGRLILQDDVTVIQDLVGIACVRHGLEGIYERARRTGDAAAMAAAAVALGDCNSIRQLVAERLTGNDIVLARYERGWLGASLHASDEQVERLFESARREPSRALRGEALTVVWVVEHAGTRRQRAQAAALLDELSADRDPLVAANAAWLRRKIPEGDELDVWAGIGQ